MFLISSKILELTKIIGKYMVRAKDPGFKLLLRWLMSKNDDGLHLCERDAIDHVASMYLTFGEPINEIIGLFNKYLDNNLDLFTREINMTLAKHRWRSLRENLDKKKQKSDVMLPQRSFGFSTPNIDRDKKDITVISSAMVVSPNKASNTTTVDEDTDNSDDEQEYFEWLDSHANDKAHKADDEDTQPGNRSELLQIGKSTTPTIRTALGMSDRGIVTNSQNYGTNHQYGGHSSYIVTPSEKTDKIFVYGIERRGFQLNPILARDGEYLGPAKTPAKYKLLNVYDRFPGMASYGSAAIVGEVWTIQPNTIEFLDRLQRVPDLHRREIISLEDGTRAYVYFINSYKIKGPDEEIKSGDWVEWKKGERKRNKEKKKRAEEARVLKEIAEAERRKLNPRKLHITEMQINHLRIILRDDGNNPDFLDDKEVRITCVHKYGVWYKCE